MATCPDCKGTKVYVGLNTTEPCGGCGGSGTVLAKDEEPRFRNLYRPDDIFSPRIEAMPTSIDPFASTDNLPPGEYRVRWNPQTKKYDVNPPGIEMGDHILVVNPRTRRRGTWIAHEPLSPLEVITNAVNELLQEPTYKELMNARISEIYREFTAYQWQKRKVVPYSSHESRPT